MKYALLLLLAFMAGCGECAPHQATMRLEFKDGVCSGTAIGPHRILSATHCFRDDELVKAGDRPVKITDRIDDGHDHTIITVDIGFDVYARRGPAPVQSLRVQWWGNPHGLSDIYRQGVIAGFYQGNILIDGNGFMGDSGAAIFDSQGRIVAVMSALAQQDGFRLMVAYPITFTDEQWR